MGHNSVSRGRLQERTWKEVCPMEGCTARNVWGPESPLVPAGASFTAPNGPESGLGRPEGAQDTLKWPRITQATAVPLQHRRGCT